MTILESPAPSRTIPWLYSLLAAAPFLLFPLIHFTRWGDEATGFTTYDLPYYIANARAILDRGHFGLYPNPFDPDPAAPVIYFHWLMTALAGLIGPLGLKPGHALFVIQIIGALASARVMYSLVAWLMPTSRWRILLYFLTMWSGGLLILGKLLANLSSGLPWNINFLALDPGQGLWCLNFGRNLILPTEAIYHALVLALWLRILKGHWNSAAWFLLAITTTHPFTGAQALAIVGVHAFACHLIPPHPSARRRSPPQTAPPSPFPSTGGEGRGEGPHNSPDVADVAERNSRYFVRKLTQSADGSAPSTPPRSFLFACAGIAIAFVSYYFLFLPRFPQHREIQHTWALGWTLPGPTILLAYTPAALLAWLAIRNDSTWRRRCRFLLIAAGVSFLLANHQWFMTPRQPIHFTRGYIWTPLFLAGLPSLAAWFDRLRARGVVVAGTLIAAFAVVAVSDNAGFMLVNAMSPTPPGFGLTKDEQAAFKEIKSWDWTGVLLTDDDRLGYLAAALTSARPWIGHKYNTPRFEERQNKLAAFKATSAAGDLLDEVDLALTTDPRVVRRLQDNDWQQISTHGQLELWRKKR